MNALRDRERMATAFFYAVLILLAYLVYRVFEPFLVPLGWAIVLVVVFHPLYVRLERRWGANRAAAATTLGVTLLLIVPTLLLMTAFVREGADAARTIQHAFVEGKLPWVPRAWEWVQQRMPGDAAATPDLATRAREAAERVAGFLASQLGAVLRNVAAFLFDLFVVIFAMFYLFRDAGAIVRGMRRVLPFDEEHREHLIAQARDLIFASVTSSLIVAAVQGFLGGLAFAVLGLGAPVFWGVVMGFFSLLPLVGAWLVWIPAAIWLAVNDQMARGVILVIGAILVVTVDHFLRPALISGRARLSGLVVFISVLGGIGVFGMLGVILGPIVVATAASVLDVYTHRKEKPREAEPGEMLLRGRNAVLE